MLSTIITVIHIIVCVALVLIVLFQSGKRSGLSGAIAGVSDTFMSKNKAKSWDARLAKSTKWVALAFVLTTFLLHIV